MTLPFNPLRAADLARQALDDDSKMTPGPWRSMRDGNQYVKTDYMPTAKCVGASRIDGVARPWNPHAYIAFGFRPTEFETVRFVDDDADGIARTRNALREMAEQLTAAVQEVERLRTIPAVDIASLANQLWEVDRDSLRASCEQLTRERDEARAEAERLDGMLDDEIEERDVRQKQIDDIADALGDEGEWSNLHDRGQAAYELAIGAVGEVESLRAELAKMRPVYNEALAWRREIIGERTSYDLRLEAAIDSALSSTHQAGTK